MKLTIYTDGASRGNPGPSSYGFIITNSNKKVVFKEGKNLGINTNNFAEYSAVLAAFQYLQGIDNPSKVELAFFMDSRLVAEQLSGRFKVKSITLKPFVKKINVLKSLFMKTTYTHVPREKNRLADALANEALDSR